jgi:hypothetical protein
VGAAVVAGWFLVYDSCAASRYGLPRSSVGPLRGPPRPEAPPGALDLVLGYTVLHFAAFAAFGVVAAALITAAEKEPRILLGLFILFWCLELFFLGFVSALDEALVGALLWWNIAIANLLAAAAMLTYFFLGHRSSALACSTAGPTRSRRRSGLRPPAIPGILRGWRRPLSGSAPRTS